MLSPPVENAIRLLLTAIIRNYINSTICLWTFEAILVPPTTTFYSLNFSFVNDYDTSRLRPPESVPALDEGFFVDKLSCEIFIIESDYPATYLRTLETVLKRAAVRKFYNRRYIFVPHQRGYHEDIFASNLLQKVFHVLVVDAKTSESRLELMKHYFVNGSEIKIDKQQILLGKDFHNIAFLDDFFRRQLPTGLVYNYGAFTVEPYVNLAHKSGIDLMLILEFCKHKQYVCNLTESTEQWGEIYQNGTGFGILGWIADGQIEAGIGGFYMQGRKLHYMDFVGPWIKLGNSCLVPLPELSVDLFTIIRIFSSLVWINIGCSFIVFLILTKCANISPPLFVVAVFLQQGTKFYQMKKSRELLLLLVSFTMILTAAYNSKFYSALTKPSFKNAIQTVKDLEESNYEWGATHISYAEPIAHSTSLTALRSKFVVIADNTRLINRFYAGKFGLLLQKLSFGVILPDDIQAERMLAFTTMVEDVYWVYTAVMVPKQTQFYDQLNDYMLNVNAAGITTIWQQSAMMYTNFKAQLALRTKLEPGPMPLILDHVDGIFLIWFCGLGISLIAFVLELSSHYQRAAF